MITEATPTAHPALSGVTLTKVTDVTVRYGVMILHGVITEVHSNWIMIKVQAMTDSDGTKVREGWLTGRDWPVAISDRLS